MIALVVGCLPSAAPAATVPSEASKEAAVTPPPIRREFRGAWIATVGNRNWPSRPGLSTDAQKAELLTILDRAVRLRLNALIFQVRPACDALYASRLEPWSEYLTGQMGQAPDPFYDPLAFAVEQAHQRGLELHAWFNPFRARNGGLKTPPGSNHISRTQPAWIRRYGAGLLWLDPGEPAAQRHAQAVILDVVKRYDIDGVHLDDYFYPYPEKDEHGRQIDFPDEATWKRYRANGGKLDRGDWRRKNVDDFVQGLSRKIKAEKSWVKFGISPFGIWRPGHPKDVVGLDAYLEIYADARKWLIQGWADYFAPQLYWSVKSNGQSYPQLLKWWAAQNVRGRHLWPGNNAVRVELESTREEKWPAEEILNQIRLTRKQPGATGNILWNVGSLARTTGGLGDALTREVYAGPALVPASPWLDRQAPKAPSITVRIGHSPGELEVSWQSPGSDSAWLWVLQYRCGDRWTTEIFPSQIHRRPIRLSLASLPPDFVAVAAVDRCGNLSPMAVERATTMPPRIRGQNNR